MSARTILLLVVLKLVPLEMHIQLCPTRRSEVAPVMVTLVRKVLGVHCDPVASEPVLEAKLFPAEIAGVDLRLRQFPLLEELHPPVLIQKLERERERG